MDSYCMDVGSHWESLACMHGLSAGCRSEARQKKCQVTDATAAAANLVSACMKKITNLNCIKRYTRNAKRETLPSKRTLSG
jgi:hypothetical protein